MSTTAQTASDPVDTGKVAGRRTLRFESIDQALADVDRLVAAEKASRLKHVGNWTLGQTLGHLATWTEYGYTGSPLKPPFFIRWILRFQKQRFLTGPMRAGVKIPRVEGGTLATNVVPLDDAYPRFRQIMERLKNEPPTALNPIFGKMSHEEQIALNLRHTELHLSFHVPMD